MTTIPPERLLEIRLAHDLRQDQLAVILGVSTRTLRRWELGTRAVDAPAAQLIIKIWGDTAPCEPRT